MKVAISGASGFVGTRLSEYLKKCGYEVVPLGRADFRPEAKGQLLRKVADCRGMINLAGAPIDRRWSDKYKRELIGSRTDVTRRLAEAVNLSPMTEVFISASAVGCYPSVGCYDEYSAARGTGFLAQLCADWEAETRRIKPQVRVAITRFGVVLDGEGGAFPRMARPARMGVAARPGSGLQPFSWIDIADLVRAEVFLLERHNMEGVFNFAAPQRLTQREFADAVAAHYKARMTVTVPAFVFRMLYGEAADFLLHGQCAVPARLSEVGFRFHSPDIETFLKRL